MASSWERLASVTLGSAGDILSSGTFTAKKHLRVEFLTIPDSTANPRVTLNNDSGSNYTRRRQEDYGSDDASTSNAFVDFGRNGTELVFGSLNIINIANEEKLVISHSTSSNGNGAENAPKSGEIVWKWVNTSDQVTSVVVTNSISGNFAVGSTITVWGADDAPFSYPNLPNGAIFEESDTGKHYMWDGTDTWNEMV